MKRYIVVEASEEREQFRSITSTINENGEVVSFDRSFNERMLDGYLEPILSVSTEEEAYRRLSIAQKNNVEGVWVVRAMSLNERGAERLGELFDWMDEEWGGVMKDALDRDFTVNYVKDENSDEESNFDVLIETARNWNDKQKRLFCEVATTRAFDALLKEGIVKEEERVNELAA